MTIEIYDVDKATTERFNMCGNCAILSNGHRLYNIIISNIVRISRLDNNDITKIIEHETGSYSLDDNEYTKIIIS